MTKAEAIAQIKLDTGNVLTTEELLGLDGCTEGQLVFILEGLKNIAAVKEKSVWDKVVDTVNQVAEWAALAVKLAGAVGTVFGV